jgi:hypothetical protein
MGKKKEEKKKQGQKEPQASSIANVATGGRDCELRRSRHDLQLRMDYYGKLTPCYRPARKPHVPIVSTLWRGHRGPSMLLGIARLPSFSGNRSEIWLKPGSLQAHSSAFYYVLGRLPNGNVFFFFFFLSLSFGIFSPPTNGQSRV